MAIGPREVSFTINVDSGKVVNHEKGSNVTQTGPDPELDAPYKAIDVEQSAEEQQEERDIGQEIADIKRSRTHVRVAEITHTHSSPGCVYWDGIRWVKFC